MKIPFDQILERWDILPESLREALYSEPSSDYLWQVCEEENVPAERIYDISRISGYVLMGFIHPEDLAGEIKNELNLPQETAGIIADKMNKRVFSSLRPDLDKIYSPVRSSGGSMQIQNGPKILSQTATGAMNISMVPISGKAATPPPAPATPPPPAPKPIKEEPLPLGPALRPRTTEQPKPVSPLSGIGWSHAAPSAPTVKLNQISAPPPKPATPPSAPIQNAAFLAQKPGATPSAAGGASIGEFERRALQSEAERGFGVPPTPPQPGAKSEPAPVMLHEDASFKPAPQAPNFHLEIPPESFDMTKGSGAGASRAAVVEFGKVSSSPMAPKPAPGPASTPRVVHYTEYKSPSPEVPIKPSSPMPVTPGPRQVTEITSTPPTAPSSPAPQMPPTMPKPTAPVPPKPSAPAPMSPVTPKPTPVPAAPTAQEKIIYKNYSPEPMKPASAPPQALQTPKPPMPQPPKPPEPPQPPKPPAH